MNLSRMLAIVGLLFVIISMKMAYAQDEDTSVDKIDGHVVNVKTWIGDEKDDSDKIFATTEQVVLNIDISTPRWFLGSTTIGKIDIPNLVAKQRKLFATNYSTTEKGQSWAHQRWEVTLYPQSSGTFTIPPLPVTVHIAGDDAKKIQGTVWTDKLSFKAHLPNGELTAKDQWFAASDAKITQSWETTKPDLKVGDAITRTINIEANDSLSILLPQTLQAKVSEQYQAYADPAQLTDTSNRGQYVSKRQDRVVYIVQDGGEVAFPPLTVKWWNTNKGTVETIKLSGKSFKVSHTPMSFIKAYWPIMVTLLGSALLLVLVVLGFKRYLKKHDAPLIVRFCRSIWDKDTGQIRLLLYIKWRQATSKQSFSQELHFSDVGEAIVKEHSASVWMQFWRKITKKRHWYKNRSWLRPLDLSNVVEKIK